MDIRPHNLFCHYPRHCCIFLGSRDCRLISRRNAIPLHPQQGTRISFKDFYTLTVTAATISTKVSSHSTSNYAGMAANSGRDLRNQRQVKEHHDVTTDFLKLMVSAGHSPKESLSISFIKKNYLFRRWSTQSTLEVMEILEINGHITTRLYNALLSVICKTTKASSAEHVMELGMAVLNRMRTHGCSPDDRTYSILIGALCRKGQLDLALEVLDNMLQENQCQPSYIPYLILIEASFIGTHDDSRNGEGNSGGITRVMKLLEEMAARGLQLTNYTYNCILREMCKHGLVDQVWQLMRTLSHQPSYTSSSSSGFKRTMVPDVKSYNSLLTELLDIGRWEDAETLLPEMVSTGQYRPTVMAHNIMITFYCRQGMVDRAIKVLHDMIARGLKPNFNSCEPINAYYCKQGRTDLAITLMEQVLSYGYLPEVENYNTILASLRKSGAAYQALEVLGKLEKIGCRPTISSYNAFIAGFWLNGDRAKAVKMVSQMVDNGIHPNLVTYNTIISCLCSDGMVHDAIQLMADMEVTWGYIPTVITYNIIILGLCKAHDMCAAIDVFQEMMERRCRPNVYTYIILLEGLAHAGHGKEARSVSRALLSCKAISKSAVSKLKKTFRPKKRKLVCRGGKKKPT